MHSIIVAGVLLAGLPVLLHLIMKQEPKRLPFPAFRFLKFRQKTNQRKMRLRHLLLLLMRMLLIALFAATLYQPVVQSQSFLNVLGDQPVMAVLIVDTSPSMGYTSNEKTRLDDARTRALELLDDLPPGSRVAVLDTADPIAAWEQSTSDARKKLESFKETRGGGSPVTSSMAVAYRLLQSTEKEADTAADPTPKLVAIFSDRTANCWVADRAEDLKKTRDGLGKPAVAHLFVDVGIDSPADVAVTDVAIRPQVIPQNQPVTVNATVSATGPDVPEAVVRCKLDGAAIPEKRSVRVPAGTPQPVQFTFRDLKPGLHQLEVSLETPDSLMFDNVRYATFRVGEARRILTITDDPDDAVFWQLAFQTKGEFACDVKKPEEVGDLGVYEAVCLISVADPSQPIGNGPSLWKRLEEYATRGGKIIIIPGGPEQLVPAAYDPASNDAIAALMPGKLGKVVETRTFPAPPVPTDPKEPRPRDRRVGVPWLIDEAALRHPLLAPFRDWQMRGNVDFLRKPRLAWKFWDVEAPPAAVVVTYDDSDDPKTRRPAVLEKSIKGQGKVLLLTTRMDTPWEDKPDRKWHDYWETSENSWYVVFPNLLVRYLCGSSADANFNFQTGQSVSVPLPRGGDSKKGAKLIFEGPGVSGRDGVVDLADKSGEWRLSPARTLTAGNFLLRTEDRTWREGFSLNPTADESNLAKVPAEAITDVCGPKSIIPAERNLKLRDVIEASTDHPIDLTPWLLIAVLLLFALEGVFSNRFYRIRSGPQPVTPAT